MGLRIKCFVFLSILLMLSCVSEKMRSTRQLMYFLEMFSFQYNNIDNVLVLTEEGCPTCNRSFANLIENHLNDPSTVIIVSAKGNTLDLSHFMEEGQVILDPENTFGEMRLTDGTSSIFLSKSGLIDTVVNIRSQYLEQDLSYVSHRLNKH